MIGAAVAVLLAACPVARAGLWGAPTGTIWEVPPEVSGPAPALKKPFWRDGAWRVSWTAPHPSAGLQGYEVRVQGRLAVATAAGVREAPLPGVPFSHRVTVDVRALFAEGRVSPWSVQVERPLPPSPDAVADVQSTITTLHGGLQNLLRVVGAEGVGFRRLGISASGTTPFGPSVLLPSSLEVGVVYDPFLVPVRSVTGSDWTPAQAPASWVDGAAFGSYDLLLRSGTTNVWWLSLGYFVNQAAGRWVGGTVGTATFPMPPSPSFPRRWDVTVRVEQPVTGSEIVAETEARFAAAPFGFGGEGVAYTSHFLDPATATWIRSEDPELAAVIASRAVQRDADGRSMAVSLRRGAVRADLAADVRAQWGGWEHDGGVRLGWVAEAVLPDSTRAFESLTAASEAVYAAPSDDRDLVPRLVAWSVDLDVDPGQRVLRDAGMVIYARRTLPVGGEGRVAFEGAWFDVASTVTLAWSGPFACRVVDPALADAAWDAGAVLQPGQDLGPWLGDLRTGRRRVAVRALDRGPGTLHAVASQAGSALQASCELKAIAVPLLVTDADRDGAISVLAGSADEAFRRAGHPWYFWINDDNDTALVRDDSVWPPQDCPGQPEDRRDAGNDHVDGLRDLVDFFPLLLDTGSPSLPVGLQWRISQADGALGVVVTDAVAVRAGRELAGHPDCLGNEDASVVVVDAAGMDVTGLLGQGGGQRVLLVEGRRATRNPLRLEAWEGGELLAAAEFPLHIGSVEAMYRLYNLRNIPFVNSQDEVIEGPGSRWPEAGGPPGYPDNQTDGTHFVAIHGLAWSREEGRGFAADVFKRFFQAGCRSRFHVILWRSDEGTDRPFHVLEPATPDYHVNCTNAWATAEHVHPILAGLEGPVTVFGHSLATVVAGRALTMGRPPGFQRLVTLNGSAPMSAYFGDPADPADSVSTAYQDVLQHPAWRGIHPDLWASNWHRLFVASHGDARARLTWTGQFASVPNVDNIYSRWDQVLRVPADGSFSLVEALWKRDEEAWANQERLKGRYAIDLVRALPGVSWRSDHGGWGFNEAWYAEQRANRRPKRGGPRVVRRLPGGLDLAESAGGVARATLATRPLFRLFDPVDSRYTDPETGAVRYRGAALLAPPGDPGASTAASDPLLVGKLLAECIPNLCAPIGGVPESGAAPQQQGLDYASHAGVWGRIAGRWDQQIGANRYLHSDYLNLPYAYVSFVYARVLRRDSE